MVIIGKQRLLVTIRKQQLLLGNNGYHKKATVTVRKQRLS